MKNSQIILMLLLPCLFLNCSYKEKRNNQSSETSNFSVLATKQAQTVDEALATKQADTVDEALTNLTITLRDAFFLNQYLPLAINNMFGNERLKFRWCQEFILLDEQQVEIGKKRACHVFFERNTKGAFTSQLVFENVPQSARYFLKYQKERKGTYLINTIEPTQGREGWEAALVLNEEESEVVKKKEIFVDAMGEGDTLIIQMRESSYAGQAKQAYLFLWKEGESYVVVGQEESKYGKLSKQFKRTGLDENVIKIFRAFEQDSYRQHKALLACRDMGHRYTISLGARKREISDQCEVWQGYALLKRYFFEE